MKVATILLLINTGFSLAFAPILHLQKRSFQIHQKEDPFDPDFEDEEESIDIEDEDWRSFRAKLVMSESQQPVAKVEEEDDLDGIGSLFDMPKMTPLTKTNWAYDSGKLIEQGAVILGGVEQDFGFGLRQQYFHKAAILVLEHTSSFTKGIILNRPSDLTLDDDVNKGVKWRIWYGGDVQGINSKSPDIVCLHSLKDETVRKASVTVMNEIQWTTFTNAKKMVQDGLAKPTDFWVFCGYAGWGPGQLDGELDRKSWYMVATDSNTLLKELARLSSGADPRDAGLDTWYLLMNMIGKKDIAEEYMGGFDDLMLKEWALKHLLSTEAGGGAGVKSRPPEGIKSTQELKAIDPIDKLIGRVAAFSRNEDVTEGMLVRASSKKRSPWLLEGQEYHKSIILVLKDDDEISIGVMLNRPAAQGIEIKITENGTGNSKTIKVPLRFGGQFAVKGSQPILWLHCNPKLRAAKIGSPFDLYPDGIWQCTSKDVSSAIEAQLATPSDFMVVSGVSVWTKGDKGLARGIQGELRKGTFEVVPKDKMQEVWDMLTKQQVLTPSNLVGTLAVANEAWALGAANGKGKEEKKDIPIGGLGENFDEEDDSMVFNSDTKVSQLSDDALRSWIATFLLGSPSLGG